MKSYKILLIAAFASLPLVAELSIDRMDKMVEEIKAKRKSKIEDRTNVKSPFVVLKVDNNTSIKESVPVKEDKIAFSLAGIMNSSAYINGFWHKKGDKIGDFIVDTISDDHVVLKRDNRAITLFFRKSNNILNIKDK